ncbi:MAG: hypothetical protein ISP91_06400 [Pseudomonadales bacterium]|nr:hypothetical protein [Pseudomonadales bacterium]
MRLVALLLALIASLPLRAEVNLTGYAKSFAVGQDELDNPVIMADEIYQSQNSLRLMWEGFSERIVWQLHYEMSPVFVSEELNASVPTFNVVEDSYRLTDIDPTLLREDNKNQVYQNLDRLNVQIQMDAGDLTIGRQAISFGSARIINPTDIFLPFDVRTFNTEYRTGVDAVRFQRPWGELGEIDVGIVLGDDADPENSAAFLQVRTNANGVDYHMAAIRFAEQDLLGFGVQSALGDMGFWFEVANVWGDEDYLRLSTGLDYAFSENTFGQVEYHYNGAGSDEPEDYLANLQTLPYQRGGVFLLGEHYLIPGYTVQLSPLWFVGLQAIVNLTDSSAFASVSAEYNVAENFYMDFGYYRFVGDDLEVSNNGLPEFGSEYGPNPNTLYMSIRYYF